MTDRDELPGEFLDPPKVDITGFESNRADVLPIAADTQKEVIKRVLAGDGFDGLSDYIGGVVDDIENLNLPFHEIAKPGVLNKPLDEYGNTPTVRACRYSNAELDMEWREGDDPWIYYIRSTPPMMDGTDVLALEWGQELPDGFEIDKDRVLEKVAAPLEPVLAETEWTFDELKTGRQMQGVATESAGNPFSGGAPLPTDDDSGQTTDPDGQEDPDDETEDDDSETESALSW